MPFPIVQPAAHYRTFPQFLIERLRENDGLVWRTATHYRTPGHFSPTGGFDATPAIRHFPGRGDDRRRHRGRTAHPLDESAHAGNAYSEGGEPCQCAQDRRRRRSVVHRSISRGNRQGAGQRRQRPHRQHRCVDRRSTFARERWQRLSIARERRRRRGSAERLGDRADHEAARGGQPTTHARSPLCHPNLPGRARYQYSRARSPGQANQTNIRQHARLEHAGRRHPKNRGERRSVERRRRAVHIPAHAHRRPSGAERTAEHVAHPRSSRRSRGISARSPESVCST